VEGVLYISNYRLYLHRTSSSVDIASISHSSSNNSVRDINVPLGLIESVECKDIFYLNLFCKDGRSFR
jgi:myotubularin-related protein 3/4